MAYIHLSKNSLSIHLLILAHLHRVTVLYLALCSLMGVQLLTRLMCVCPHGVHGEDRHVDKHDDQMC